MRSPFYQANFCAECGNRLEPRVRFGRLYFCDECAARLKQRKLLTPMAGWLLIASLTVFAFSYKRGSTRNQPPNAVTPESPVSARDSVVHPNPKPQTDSKSRVFCGARTRRGTPCRHLVQPGQRCAQHRGMASVLDAPSGESTPSHGTPVTR